MIVAAQLRKLSTFVLLSAAGCMKAPPAPAPEQLHVDKSPGEIVRAAVSEFTAAGFQISQSDTAAGTVVARKTGSPDTRTAEIACKYQRGSPYGRLAQATLVLALSAKPSTTGSDVVITSVVHTDFSALPGAFNHAPNDTDCVSSGAVEKRIAAALR